MGVGVFGNADLLLAVALGYLSGAQSRSVRTYRCLAAQDIVQNRPIFGALSSIRFLIHASRQGQ